MMPKAKTKSQTISKFFHAGAKASKSKLPSNASPGSGSTEKSSSTADSTRQEKTVNYARKRQHSDEQGDGKRLKIDAKDTPNDSDAATCTGISPVKLSESTKIRLESFIHNCHREEQGGVESIAISDLKRPDANHIVVTEKEDEDRKSVSFPSLSEQNDNDSDEECSHLLDAPTVSNSKARGKLSQFSAATVSVKIKPKYTPLEQQFMEIKEKYPDAVLFVECGYKYRFFGDDAEIAAKELNIFAHPDHNFMTASIPVHRLHVHVQRLVAKGYKVGVVKQTETAALKAAGDNKNTPFTRQLSALYTKTTLIGEDVDPMSSTMPGQSSSAHLMCIYEPDITSRNKVHQVAIVSVQPSTGEIVYDIFSDVPTRSELEMRIAHIQPAELLLPHSLTTATEKVIKQLTAFSCRTDDRLRLERLNDKLFESAAVHKGLSDFYEGSAALASMLKLPTPVLSCFHALVTYLTDFNLHNTLKLSSNVRKFSSEKRHLQLPANTTRNLELFVNLTDGRRRGSLIWVLDHTSSRFGERMLQQWLAKPLLDISAIKERQDAITDLLTNNSQAVCQLSELLTNLPDVEKGLCTIFHKRCSTQEFLTVCKALSDVYKSVAPHKNAIESQVKSKLLQTLFIDLPDLLEGVTDWVNAINPEAAKDGDKTKLFVDESCYPGVVKCKSQIQSVLEDLDQHRKEVAKTIGLISFTYKTIMGTEFIIDVKNSDVKRVPKDWLKINSTKATSRFHSPFIIESYKKLSQLREKLAIECTQAWNTFLESFEEVYPRYRRAVEHLATLDCLLSLTQVSKQEGFCRPTLIPDGSSEIRIEAGRHPVVDSLLGEQEQYVPNDTNLSAAGKRCMVITGPNMGGKSSYIKQVALLTIMAQMGSYLPAESASMGVVNAIFTRMGASDELFAGRSTFMVELLEAAEVMNHATSNSLVILDELGRGTSTHDGVAIAHATLRYFVEQVKCMTLFVTHYPPLADIARMFPDHVTNHHMSFLISDDEQGTDKTENSYTGGATSRESLTFLYQLVEGAAGRSYGLNVARLAGIPEEVLRAAQIRSRLLEESVSTRWERKLFSRLYAADEAGMLRRQMTDMRGQPACLPGPSGAIPQ